MSTVKLISRRCPRCGAPAAPAVIGFAPRLMEKRDRNEVDGDEGVCAFNAGGTWMPMVAADEARVESMREMARKLAKAGGQPIGSSGSAPGRPRDG